MRILDKIQRRLLRMRLCPIRVFSFHQVSDIFDETTMYRNDWMQTEMFKSAIANLRDEGYIFISLQEAYEKLKHDAFRFRKYAVLTSDDGWASLRNILPWLNEQQIPITLFLNPAYLDGKHFRERKTEKYLTETEVLQLQDQYPFLTIGSHGFEHKDVYKMSKEEFEDSLLRTEQVLSSYPNYVPFYAFAWGRYTKDAYAIVQHYNLVPVLMDGQKNYFNQQKIHRELLQ